MSDSEKYDWTLTLATGLIRRRWLDCIGAAPPLLLWVIFKIYVDRTAAQQFKYYNPTAQEAEMDRRLSMGEKRLRHSDVEKRFLHPALQADKLYTIMVHKSQESLAREVLSAYPWFTSSKHDKGGVYVKAVREENLEYNPERDGPRDEAHQAEWDARSVASTDLLGGGAKSEAGTPFGNEGYNQYPFAADGQSVFNSNVNLPLDNPSTDHLLAQDLRQPRFAGSRLGAHHSAPSTDSISNAPLVSNAQDFGQGGVPYPPSAYTQPPIGYTPPTMRRTASGLSDDEPRSRWDTGSDLGVRSGLSSAPSYTTVPQYDDPYGGSQWPDQSRQGYDQRQVQSGGGVPRRQGSNGYEMNMYDQPRR